MDDLDRALEAAWARVGPTLSEEEVRRRRLRRQAYRNVAPWCLCIRASDPRISEFHAQVDDREALREGRGHVVQIGAPLIRRLCTPVRILWPGVPVVQAAYLLGRSRAVVDQWIKRGILKTRRARRPAGRGLGKYELRVWTEGPVNCNAHLGRIPDALWGTAWQWAADEIPDDFQVIVRREQGRGLWLGDHAALGGWEFVCPGLAGGEQCDEIDGPRAEVRTCGRRVDKLYVPLRGMTWARWAQIAEPPQSAAQPAGAPARTPSDLSPLPTLRLGMRAACARCHRVVTGAIGGPKMWNLFIAVVTGGLLYGREVPKPAVFARHRARRRRVNDAAPQRERVQTLFLAGFGRRQIAAKLGIGPGTVANHIRRLYRIHAVRSRISLAASLGVAIDPGMTRGDPATVERAGGVRLTPRLLRALDLMIRGLSPLQIADTMGVRLRTVRDYQGCLYRLYRVHSRTELVAKVAALKRARVKGVLAPRAAQALRLVGE